MNCLQFRNLLFCLGQCILLFVVVGIRHLSRDDVFLPDAASVDRTFTRINPVFTLCQCVVIDATALLQPVKHLSFLVKSWIDSVAVGQVQHSAYILTVLRAPLEKLCGFAATPEPFCISTLIKVLERRTYLVLELSNQFWFSNSPISSGSRTLQSVKCQSV